MRNTNTQFVGGTAPAACGKTPTARMSTANATTSTPAARTSTPTAHMSSANAGLSVEERPFEGRVTHIESMRASAPVVVFVASTYVFRNLLGLAILLLLVLPACSINVKKEKNGQDKQVDIQTPVGGIHVSKDVDAADVGLTVYPGARLKQKDSNGENKSANVNISSFGYGLRVVAMEYESDDAPAKVVAFYQDQLKKYGNILVCHTNHLDVNTDMKGLDDHGSHELTCENSSGKNVELKVGTKENQHIVAVEPEGQGSSFSLVYVRTHGKDADI